MAAPLFEGVGAALVTFFHEKRPNRLDLEATADLAEALEIRGVSAFLVCGTTGQANALTRVERGNLLESIVARIPVGKPVIAGTTGETAKEILDDVAAAAQTGVDALLVPPSADVENIVGFYEAVVARAGGLPVLSYNIPTVYKGIPFELLSELSALGVVAHKDSSGDMERLAATVNAGLTVYTGSSYRLTDAAALGAPGALVGISNAFPEMSIAAFDGDALIQEKLSAKMRILPKGEPFGSTTKMLMKTEFPGMSLAVRDPSAHGLIGR